MNKCQKLTVILKNIVTNEIVKAERVLTQQTANSKEDELLRVYDSPIYCTDIKKGWEYS